MPSRMLAIASPNKVGWPLIVSWHMGPSGTVPQITLLQESSALSAHDLWFFCRCFLRDARNWNHHHHYHHHHRGHHSKQVLFLSYPYSLFLIVCFLSFLCLLLLLLHFLFLLRFLLHLHFLFLLRFLLLLPSSTFFMICIKYLGAIPFTRQCYVNSPHLSQLKDLINLLISDVVEDLAEASRGSVRKMAKFTLRLESLMKWLCSNFATVPDILLRSNPLCFPGLLEWCFLSCCFWFPSASLESHTTSVVQTMEKPEADLRRSTNWIAGHCGVCRGADSCTSGPWIAFE